MKRTHQSFLLAAGLLSVVALAPTLLGANTNAVGAGSKTMADTNTNGVPDRLKTCPVSKDKLGGDMGAPFIFSYQGQEVKLCCKSCKSDFDKNPAKYMKLIRAADKK